MQTFALIFANIRTRFGKIPQSILQTFAVISENDRSGFEKRPQWF